MVAREAELLASNGSDVEVVEFPNPEGLRASLVDLLRVRNNRRVVKQLAARIDAFSPDIIHYHNTWFAAGPAALCADASPVTGRVITLHNYRLSCAGGEHLREGKVCTECLGGSRWPAIEHGCYRDSRPLTALNVSASNRTLANLNGPMIDRVICVSDQVRHIAEIRGVDSDRTAVVPNFVNDPLRGREPIEGEYRIDVVFAGRVTKTKGIEPLLEAWRQAQLRPDFPKGTVLHLAGQPEPGLLPESIPNVVQHGFLSEAVLSELIGRSRALIFPSLWWEGQPLTVIEALAAGTPVLGADQPSIRDIIGGTDAGVLHPPGATDRLVDQIVDQLRLPTEELDRQILAARKLYEERFAPAAHLEALGAVYDSVRRTRQEA